MNCLLPFTSALAEGVACIAIPATEGLLSLLFLPGVTICICGIEVTAEEGLGVAVELIVLVVLLGLDVEVGAALAAGIGAAVAVGLGAGVADSIFKVTSFDQVYDEPDWVYLRTFKL